MNNPPPVIPGTVPRIQPFVRWIVIFWVGMTVLGLTFLAGSLVWAGWFADASQPLPAGLPRWAFPLLALPVVVAVFGYGFTIWRVWRRQPATNAWLVGIAGHFTYLVADITLSGGISPAEVFSLDGIGLWIRALAPGLLILMIERDRFWNPDLR